MIPIEPDTVNTGEGKCEKVFFVCRKELSNLVRSTLILVCNWSFFVYQKRIGLDGKPFGSSLQMP